MIINNATNIVYFKSITISTITTINFCVAVLYFKKFIKLMKSINNVIIIVTIRKPPGNVSFSIICDISEATYITDVVLIKSITFSLNNICSTIIFKN